MAHLYEEDTKGINQYYVSTRDSLLQAILDKTDAGNEKDVFTIAPESFSAGGKNIFAAYAIHVGIIDMDFGN